MKKSEFTLTIRMIFRLSGIFPSYLETVQTIGMIFRLSGIFPGYPEIFQAIQKRKSPSHRPPSAMRKQCFRNIQSCRAKVTYDPKKKHYRDLHLWPKTSFNLSNKTNKPCIWFISFVHICLITQMSKKYHWKISLSIFLSEEIAIYASFCPAP